MSLRRKLLWLAAALAMTVIGTPAFAQTRFPVLPGVLFVDIQGSYPQGFVPKWAIVQATMDVPAAWENHVARPGPYWRRTIPMRLAEDGDKLVVVLDNYCVAVLSDQPVVLSQRPIEFQLHGFHNVNANMEARHPNCGRMDTYQTSLSGAMRLAADADGNLIVDLDLGIYSNRGALSFRAQVDAYREPNRMTPLMARQEMDRREIAARKEREAAAQAEAELTALKRRAAAGDVPAMLAVGTAYLNDGGNEAEGVRLLAAAATKGSNEAAFKLAERADNKGDYASELRWYKVAAARGVPEAMYNLGLMAKKGQGMTPSLALARSWMKQAAEKGDDDAIKWLQENNF